MNNGQIISIQNPLLFDSQSRAPRNLCAQNDLSGFPIFAIPEKIRDAIFEVWRATQAPLPLVVTSALSALSMACQHIFDASRPNGMKSPCSLFFITIADSGERKTSSDKFFTRSIRDFEARNLEMNKRLHFDYAVNLKIWQVSEAGLKRKIQRLINSGKSIDAVEQQLRDHYHRKPQKPQIMRMLFDDVSPTAIIGSLHDQWPSAGIISDEAGKIFNSKTFENIGLYNKLWDGDQISLDRHRTADSYTVTGGRLTVSLMTQRQTFRDFLAKQGNLARDNGFLARCLISWPISTQGLRHIDADAVDKHIFAMPALDEFQRLITFLLDKSWQHHKSGTSRKIIAMSPDAARAWNRYYNNIENLLGEAAFYADVRDGASKMAENISRLACLFQIFECCEREGEWKVDEKKIHAADAVCGWYMAKFKSIFGSNNEISEDAASANELHVWLEKEWHRTGNQPIPKSYILQYGPSKLRTKRQRELALNILVERRIIVIQQAPAMQGKKPPLLIVKAKF